MFLLLLCLGTENMKDLLRAKTCFSHTHLSTQRSQLVLQTRSGSYPGLIQALRMCIYMKDCDQVLGHFGNTIQGQAGWKFQRDHLLDTLNAEGLGTDQAGQRCSLSRVLPTQPGLMEGGPHCGRVQSFWCWAEMRNAPKSSEVCAQSCAGNRVLLTLAMTTDTPSLETETPVCYHGQKGLHPEFSGFRPLPEDFRGVSSPFLCHCVTPSLTPNILRAKHLSEGCAWSFLMPSLSFYARNLLLQLLHHSNTYIISLETSVFLNVNHSF